MSESEPSPSSKSEKTAIRERVSNVLVAGQQPIALPDSVFDLQLDHYITDFQQNTQATERLTNLPEWIDSKRVFITPDNSTQLLREKAIRQHKEVIMTTFGIRRGSLLIKREMVPPGQEEYAATLVGMEKFAEKLPSITDLERVGHLDLMVTGALAISRAHGGRAGKGAGWFDAEWGIWKTLNLVHPNTPIIGIVHDVQLVPEAFGLDPWDCHMTIIVSPSEVIRITGYKQPEGILWNQITTKEQRNWLAAIPYMNELHRRQFGKPFIPD